MKDQMKQDQRAPKISAQTRLVQTKPGQQVLKIPAQTRLVQTKPDQRVLKIPEQTRLVQTKPDQQVLKIPEQTRLVQTTEQRLTRRGRLMTLVRRRPVLTMVQRQTRLDHRRRGHPRTQEHLMTLGHLKKRDRPRILVVTMAQGPMRLGHLRLELPRKLAPTRDYLEPMNQGQRQMKPVQWTGCLPDLKVRLSRQVQMMEYFLDQRRLGHLVPRKEATTQGDLMEELMVLKTLFR